MNTMILRMLCVGILASVALFAHAEVLDEFERALIAGDFAKAKGQVAKMSGSESSANVRGLKELVRVMESCEDFISLADQHMIAPSSVPVSKLETAYDAIEFKESDFAVSNAVVDLLNERLHRASQMMEFAHHESNPTDKIAAVKEAQDQEKALKAECGMDYRNLKLGMTLDRVKLCVGTPYFVDVFYRRGMLVSTYKVDQRYVQVLDYQVIGWAK